ncbi:MAG: ketosteroid isomerase family protein [Oculatellaceae cyanobacterium bins.114]|nr:ketosteroid isomerase family protein [Oculatellaceae cyanobacterium bins.114]
MTDRVDSTAIALPINAISEPVILTYFETLNAGDFQATADLFDEVGILYPPFDEALVGREAIAHYLATEAKGMKFQPLTGTYGVLETGDTEFTIAGKVQTPLFGVNVVWDFVLNPHSQILSVRIKLLANLQELLSLKSE